MRARDLIPTLSDAEAWALAGAAALLALQASGLAPLLEYRRSLLMAEPWRLLTAHLVHVGWHHTLLNAVAWIAVARLFAGELTARRQLIVLAFCALAISALLAGCEPQLAWYRGLSGALHGLFAAGAVTGLAPADGAPRHAPRGGRRWLPAFLLAAVWLKVLYEQIDGATLAPPAWLGAAVVTRAHLFGAAAGTAAGLAILALHRYAPIKRRCARE